MIKGNLRVVIGSKSTGGDTYQNSSIVAEALAKKLEINVKVDAVGATAAFRTIEPMGARGNTVMIFHDQSYLGYLYSVTGYENIFKKYIVGPTVAINPGNAYLVPKNSPYKRLEDVIEACGKGTRVRVAIQPGGVSEIGYSALKNAIKTKYPGKEINLVAVNTGSQADKNQLLFQGQADVINGSVQANEQYTRLPAEDQKAQKKAFFIPDFMPSKEAQAHLFFPKIVTWFLLLQLVVVFHAYGIPYIHDVRNGKRPFPFSGGQWDNLRFFGTIVLTIIYFLSMDAVGEYFPNTGLGFLFTSIVFIFILSLLYVHGFNQRKMVVLNLNALISPCVAWYVLAHLSNISLP